jgi:hypothetical protein
MVSREFKKGGYVLYIASFLSRDKFLRIADILRKAAVWRRRKSAVRCNRLLAGLKHGDTESIPQGISGCARA